MSSRPRRSCARGDTSILSPSTIFLWSDARLKQELTRRGLSRTGIRQDLIDRLLDDINGVIKKEEPCTSALSEIAKDTTSESQAVEVKREPESDEASAENINVSDVVESESPTTKRRGKRKTSVSDSTPQTEEKRRKLTVPRGRKKPSATCTETPAARPRRFKNRASAGEDVAASNKTVADSEDICSHPTTDASLFVDQKPTTEETMCPPAQPTPTCSIMKPILSILPKVRPLPSALLATRASSSAEAAESTTEASNRPQRSSDSATPSPMFANNDIYDSSADDKSPTTGKPSVIPRKSSSSGSTTAVLGTIPSSKRIQPQKDEDDRHHQRKISSLGGGTSKSDRLNASKPITEAWAERLAELKKADPGKYSAGSAVKEKSRERDLETRRKSSSTKPSVSSAGPTSGNVKKPASSTSGKARERVDLLDTILNQQSEFLQTMRRSEDRCSPEPVRAVQRNEQSEENIDLQNTERGHDLSGAAEEAYRRFEQTFSESNSSKSSPRSPQFLPLLPPPPPPPKPIQTAPFKKGITLSADMVQLLVPPPPPPPPQPPMKDVPPPPPPRRPKVNDFEDLPPPPPPPKRLKPARSTPALNKEPATKSACNLEPKQEVPSENSKVDDLAIMADVRTCLEYAVFLVSSIRPFDEISGDLLPGEEVPVPFLQRSERITASELHDSLSSSAETLEEKTSEEQPDSSAEAAQSGAPKEDEEEYDPLDATAIEDFEAYVPSAVIARPTDELDPSITPSLDGAEHEQYSPGSAAELHIDDDHDEGEITEDSDSDIQSIADSDDESEGDDGENDQGAFMRHDENGRLVRVMRRTRKRNDQIDPLTTQLKIEVTSSVDESARNEAEEEIEKKPDREILDNPRHLLQRASAVLQGLGNGQETQYTQMPYDDDYEEEECVQPMDSFHGEPVPDDDDLFEVAAGLKPKRKEEVIIEERIPESTEEFEIDFYNGDLHLKGAPDNDWIIDPDNQDGLALVWGGVRSTHGILSKCRQNPESSPERTDENLRSIVFQVKITDLLPTRHLPFDELDPNDIRVGFSFRSSPLVLGEYPSSYCCTSLGKKANSNVFTDYGDSFGVGDVITAELDFEKGNISFWKNTECMGVAFANVTIPEDEAVYPHICVKNCRVSVNFGTFPGGEEEWIKRPEWTFPNSLPSSQTERAPTPPESKSDCTVLMMVGLPSVGKTTWVRRYIREHPKEHWTLISADTILASMKVNGVSRNSSHIGRWDMVLGLVGKARNRLLSLAARRRRNYILDFTNCDPETRKKRLALFEGFFRQCVTIVPSDEVMQQRHAKHLRQNRGEGTAAVPIETFLELKAVMEMPVVSEFLESVIYVDPAMEDAQIAIDRIAKFNEEGRPWYSSKYNKKRGFWNGTYGDEPYRKPSATQTRTQAVSSAEKNHSETLTVTAVENVSSVITSDAESEKTSPTTVASLVKLVQISPLEPVNKLPEKLAPISVNGSENVKVPAHSGMTLSMVSPPTVNRVDEPQNVVSVPPIVPVVFDHPPPSNPSLVVQPRPTNLPPVVQPQVPPPPPPPLSTVPQISPFPVTTSATSHSSPLAVQVTNFSPRRRWDAPPPVLPNFSIPPPSLVTPNLFVPNVATMPPPPIIPLIPNTSIPPPNVPPPGWPHHLG
ncbi:SPRY domain protein [Trichostrongylus colubriformis]|uniref:SPRY domain protein n=1 Tax=Trichostrongylus colubriformis TaxID=6319 RepID=A0AAN8FM23_TRICO